jgi:hypothetical protein
VSGIDEEHVAIACDGGTQSGLKLSFQESALDFGVFG